MAASRGSSTGTGPTARARVHGEFLRDWESNAPLTESQVALCQRLDNAVSSSRCKRDAILQQKQPYVDTETHPETYLGADGLKGLKTVSTPEEFHAWHNEMERRLEEANNDKFRRIIGGLEEDRTKALEMLETVSVAEQAIADICTGREEVASVTDQFRLDCETMVAERGRLGELADALRKRLAYFEELETLTVRFGGGKKSITPTHPDFVKMLHRLDECVAYASSSTGAVADADGYLVRFLELQRRAFSMVRDHTVTLLRDTATQIIKELRDERTIGNTFCHAELSDAAKEYLRFRTIAGGVKSFMAELYSRAKSLGSNPPSTSVGARRRSSFRTGTSADVYSAGSTNNVSGMNTNPLFSTRSTALALFSDCEECFMEQRRRLIDPSVQAHVKSLAEDNNMIALARLGSTYVIRVCVLERQLYGHFFPSGDIGDVDSEALATALKSMCDVVYNELRPLILQENDLDKLVYLIEVLKTEILGDEVPRRGAAGTAFVSSAQRAVADAQERIIYRAEVYLRDEIRSFAPQPIHLDYPERLLRQQRLMAESSGLPTSLGDSNSSIALNIDEDVDAIEPLVPKDTRTQAEKDTEEAQFRNGGIYSAWYPPVERTLRLLSMLYRCVDARVFAGVAQESVAACVQLVSNAASRIEASGKPDAADHAQLFLVWQLLMTREQISPFDVEMSYTEHELDFSELRSLLGSVIRGRLSLRSLTTPPAVREKVEDSKRELDHRVKSACESFILKTTRMLFDPILAFLAKCNAMPVTSQTGETPLKEGEVPPTPPRAPFETLKNNGGSFADPNRLRETWQKVVSVVENDLPKVVERMKIYITKSASRAVLLRPIRKNIADAAKELLSAVQTRYTLEERAHIRIDGEAIRKLLELVDNIMGIRSRTHSAAQSPIVNH